MSKQTQRRIVLAFALAAALGVGVAAVGAVMRPEVVERIVPPVTSADLPVCAMGACWW